VRAPTLRGGRAPVRLLAALLAGFLLSLALLGPAAADGALYQVSTLQDLSAGGMEGIAPFSDLAAHGDFGIGTLEGLNGEMIALDGVFYQATSEGLLHKVPPTARTPFAQVLFFKGAVDLGRVGNMSLEDLSAFLASRFPLGSRLVAVRVDGDFDRVKYRSVPLQKPPYPTLAEALKSQRIFDRKNLSGTLVGFISPASAGELSARGTHLHFVEADRVSGGHVLEVSVRGARVKVVPIRSWTILFPERSVVVGGAAPSSAHE
jgi:acetolactate decarboxylase